jgi:glutamate-1-semialdehyde 2,1-aminomutase
MIPDGNAQLVEEELAGDSDIAAVIIEPSGASWGRVPLDPDFLRALREITLRNGVQLIFDEVITGFRFSPGGAQGLYEIVPDLTSLAKVVAGGMPGAAVAGRADIMSLFDITGDAHHDRHQRVAHQGTFNAAPLSAAAGVVALNKIATGKPIEQANELARMLRSRWNAVLERHGIAGYVYGQYSTFHVYFETDKARIESAQSSDDLRTGDAMRLKGMSHELINAYQLLLRHHGVDLMSSTGGVLSSVHTEADIDAATDAFEKTIGVLQDQQLIYTT